MQKSKLEPDKGKCACGRRLQEASVYLYRSHTDRYLFHRCDCGTEKTILGKCLLYVGTLSCGCWQSEVAQANAGEANACFRHGHSGRGRNRRLAPPTPEYCAWLSARNRCHNPSNPAWPRYGWLGVEVPALGRLRALPHGHGAKADAVPCARPLRPLRRLRAWQCQMGVSAGTGVQSARMTT